MKRTGIAVIQCVERLTDGFDGHHAHVTSTEQRLNPVARVPLILNHEGADPGEPVRACLVRACVILDLRVHSVSVPTYRTWQLN